MNEDILLNKENLISLINSFLEELYEKDHYLIDNSPMDWDDKDGKN